MASTLAQIRKTRIEKAEKLRKLGINPYPAKAERTHKCREISTGFGELEGDEVTIVGRVMAVRGHGAVAFYDLADESGKVQLYIKEDNVKKAPKGYVSHKHLDLLDIGDFIEVTGKVAKTQRGEISVEVKKIKLLTKAIRPLPEKWEGLKDMETRLRRRYLDMAMKPETRDLFLKKGMFWKHMREYLEGRGFIEIRTPVLEHTTGGADANPFTTHHDALDTDFYLRISLELPLKRAIGGGFEKVFEIGPVFRNEGIDDEHLQDYDMMEFYWAYADYKQGMDLVREMYKHVAESTFGTLEYTIGDFKVDLGKEWEEIDYVGVIKDKHGIDVLKADEKKLSQKLNELKVDYDPKAKKPRLVDALWKHIRKDIAGPAFLINHPKFVSPLAKTQEENDELTERYQVILAGSEMGNGYSELNDPVDQYNRFVKQQEMREGGDKAAMMLDIDFVEMLEYGMAPTTGLGVSERLFSFLANKPIRQTVMFPQMKRHVDATTKEIYNVV